MKAVLNILFAALLLSTLPSPAAADPTILYSTYLGGSSSDSGQAVAAWHGNTFVAGITRSGDYPLFNGGSGKPGDSYTDVFLTVLGPSGSPLYSTYVPTSEVDNKYVVGVGVGPDGGPSGSPYVVSAAVVTEDTTVSVVKLWPGGTIAWTLNGTFSNIQPVGMTVDSQGNVYITGRNYNEVPGGGYLDQVFVWKINAQGSTVYNVTIDGNGFDMGRAVAVDSAGNAYVTGITLSTNLPKAIQAVPNGGYNVFVTKLDPAGAVQWSTYLGGSGDDVSEEIAVAADGTVVVAGTTRSIDFPTQNAIQTSLQGAQDLFVARLQPWGSRISSTYLGGSGNETLNDLALEPASILLAVVSPDGGSPLRVPLDPSCGSEFVAKLDARASRVLDAACRGSAVAADSTGVSVTGAVVSGLPVVNAWQPSPGGGTDAFATKLVLNHAPDCSRATASPGSLWPADGRFLSSTVGGVTDVEGDALSLAITSIFQDEWITIPGTPDASGLGTPTARLRASRLNGGDGRVYHVRFTATDSHGAACAGEVRVCVPIVQGGTCGDGGACVDSTRSY